MDEYIRLMNKSEDYIEQNLSESISLDDLARNANMSKYHFHRLFSKYNEETVKQFITRIKMERSGMLLIARPDLSITELAFRYGYNDASTYSKAFKKHMGMSPSAFRTARNDKPS